MCYLLVLLSRSARVSPPPRHKKQKKEWKKDFHPGSLWPPIILPLILDESLGCMLRGLSADPPSHSGAARWRGGGTAHAEERWGERFDRPAALQREQLWRFGSPILRLAGLFCWYLLMHQCEIMQTKEHYKLQFFWHATFVVTVPVRDGAQTKRAPAQTLRGVESLSSHLRRCWYPWAGQNHWKWTESSVRCVY